MLYFLLYDQFDSYELQVILQIHTTTNQHIHYYVSLILSLFMKISLKEEVQFQKRIGATVKKEINKTM